MSSRRILFPLIALSVLSLAGTPALQAAARTVSVHGKHDVPLDTIAALYSMRSSAAGKTVRLQNRWNTLEFTGNDRRCRINGTLVWLSSPVRKAGRGWAVAEDDFTQGIDPALRPETFARADRSTLVVLDPGHGGRDKGAVSPRKVYEKLMTYDIAKRVRTHLRKQGLRVEFTRNGDQFVSLSGRCRKAAALGADLFISIHADSAGNNRTADGAGTFILSLPGRYSTHAYGNGTPPSTAYAGNRHNPGNALLGLLLQQQIVKSTGQKDRGVKRARFQVLREAPCPAVLVETAFLSNPEEEAMVIAASGREKIARGIANGIVAYLNAVSRAAGS